MCVKAVDSFWTKQLGSDIKTKKTLKYLSVQNLRIGHLVWRTVESSVADTLTLSLPSTTRVVFTVH